MKSFLLIVSVIVGLCQSGEVEYKAKLKPEVKRFVKEQCGANKRDEKRKYINQACDIYPDLFIEFIGGKPPVITFQDNPAQPVDLTNFKNDQIHELLKERGFERVAPPPKEEEEVQDKPKESAPIVDSEEQRKKKLEALEQLKNMKDPFKAGGIFNKLKNLKDLGKKAAEKAKENVDQKESVEIPAEAEPEYESPTADEKTIRSNKRTETTAPVPEEGKEEL